MIQCALGLRDCGLWWNTISSLSQAKHGIRGGHEWLEFRRVLFRSYIDRLRCEFRDLIQEHFVRREVVRRPRFRTEREDWVQRVVADGHAICILPERSAAAPGLVTRPIEGLTLERE